MGFFSKRKKEEEELSAPKETIVPIPVEQTLSMESDDILASRLDMMDSSITSIRGWVEDSRSKIANLEGTIDEFVPRTKDDVEEIKNNINSMSEKVQQLMSLYEVISTQYNPFIDTSTIPAPTSEDGDSKEEREITELLRSIAPEEFEVSGMASGSLPEETIEIGALPGEEFGALDERNRNYAMMEGEEFGALDERNKEYAEIEALSGEDVGIFKEGFEVPELKSEIVLKQIPSDYGSNAYAMKLLEFLVGKIGRKNLPDLLDYYMAIEWISKEAKERFIDLASGISIEEGTVKDWKLVPDDNLRTLQFIEQIRGYPIKKSLLEEIERKIEKIKE